MKQNSQIWVLKFFILVLGFLPSLTNYFLFKFNTPIFVDSNIPQWYCFYIPMTYLLVYFIKGSRVLTFGIAAASLICIPVLFFGSIIRAFETGFEMKEIVKNSVHYINVFITTLAVTPISVSIFASVPIKSFESNLINRAKGVTFLDKMILMSTRLINHIVYTVIPDLLIVMREERKFKIDLVHEDLVVDALYDNFKRSVGLIVKKINDLSSIGKTATINSLEFVPLWALEIFYMPSKKEIKNEKKNRT